jgi:hypothetical protein
VLGIPLSIIWTILRISFFLVLTGLIVGWAGLIISIVGWFLIATYDLIFRTNVNNQVGEFYNNQVVPYLYPYWLSLVAAWNAVVAWSEQVGLTGVLVQVGSFIATLFTEILRTLILLLLFFLIGSTFYHLRVARRLTYASIEIAVSIVAMLVATNAMAGGNFSIQYILALLSGLYIMVRGLQNIDDALSAAKYLELEPGTNHAWHELWQAIFYGPYTKSSFDERAGRIDKALKMFNKDKPPQQTGMTSTVPSETAPLVGSEPQIKNGR